MSNPNTKVIIPTSEGDVVIYITKTDNGTYILQKDKVIMPGLGWVETRAALFDIIKEESNVTGEVTLTIPLGVIDEALTISIPFCKFIEKISA